MSTTARRAQLLTLSWRSRSLRRLCLAYAGFRVAELGAWTALTAYAYTAGGVREASTVMVAQLVPATAFALAVGALIRRYGAGAVLKWGLASQSAAMLAAAVFLHQGQNAGGFAAAIVATTAVATMRPAQSVLTPSMVDGPDELTAANVLSGALSAGAGLAGPAVAAVLMMAVGTWAVFAVMAAVVAASTAASWRLPSGRTAIEEDADSLIAGIRATARASGPRVMVLALAACYFALGALDVLAVVIAVELLGKTEAYSGYLNTTLGVGAVIAGGLGLLLIGRRWIAPWIVISGIAIGVALVGVSFAGSRVAFSMGMLVAVGAATTTFELTSLMLLQRVSRLDLIGHVFALVEALQMMMLAIGVAIVPLAVHLFGAHWTPAAVGMFLVLLAAALGMRVVYIDRHARVPVTEMAVLRSTSLFGALPGPALETVAREAQRVEIPAGDVIVQQGDPGVEYFAVISGRLAVAIDSTDRRELGPGDDFGEVALIRDVPRSATVRAITDAVLLVVDRQTFLTAVTGHATTLNRASSIATEHLNRFN